jgi:uncharacterized repeat protein (TIGR02543 family)
MDFTGITWGGTYRGSNMTASETISVGAKTSYTVSYNANGGSPTPSSQKKWHGENLQVTSTVPKKDGHTFQGWLSSLRPNDLYSPNENYGYNSDTTMVAQWSVHTYTVKYNANGGSGAPASQTKTYGVNLTLSSTKPTRTNYNFLGWSTSASATAASYSAGSAYKTNADTTLYAVWELSYIKPRIAGLKVSRCDSAGTIVDTGTYAYLTFGWGTDRSVSSVNISWSSTSGGSGSTSISASGTSGSVSEVIGGGAFSTESTYTITITVTDSDGSSTATTSLPGMAFAIDFKAGGKGVSFGKPAEREGYADFEYRIGDRFGTEVLNGLAAYTGGGDNGIDPNTTLEELCLTSHSNAPEGLGTFYFIRTVFYNTKSANANRAQIAFPYNKTGTVRHRYYSSGSWSSWTNVSPDIGWMRIDQDRMLFYGSLTDANNGSDAKSWFGHYNNNTTLYMINLASDGIRFRAYTGTDAGNGYHDVCVLSDRMRPGASDTLYLGDSNNKWKAVYAVNGTIQTSDRNQKKNIQSIDERYIALFDKLHPVSFEFSDAESDRVHIGFISQDVEAAMAEVGLTDLDFAGFCKDALVESVSDINPETGEETTIEKTVVDNNGNPVYVYSLRYSEFIALNTRMIQLNQEKITSQQNEINELKSEVEDLKKLVTTLINNK